MRRSIRIAKKIHLWSGLVCGLIVSISGLSGAFYVWQPEITAVLSPNILKINNKEQVTEEAIHQTAFKLYQTHAEKIAHILLPYREQKTIQVIFKNGKACYFHPESGNLLGEKTEVIKLFEGLLIFHRTLFIPIYGKYIMGGSAVIFFLFLLTSGFYLWWKRYLNNLNEGITISRKTGVMVFNYELHKVTGILFLVPLLIAAFSGSYFTFIPVYKKIFQIVDVIPSQIASYINETHFLDPEQLLLTPDDTYVLRAVYFPLDSVGSYHFRYISDRGIKAGLRKTKEIKISKNHQVSYIGEYTKSPRSHKISSQMYPLHIGEISGLPGRILIFISGFVPAILWITGYRFFRNKNSKRSISCHK